MTTITATTRTTITVTTATTTVYNKEQYSTPLGTEASSIRVAVINDYQELRTPKKIKNKQTTAKATKNNQHKIKNHTKHTNDENNQQQETQKRINNQQQENRRKQPTAKNGSSCCY